jgi:transposase InsO family protein
MSDAWWDGKRFRTFNVIDDFNREALAIEIDTGISANKVVRILDQIALWRGLPTRIRFDNKPELRLWQSLIGQKKTMSNLSLSSPDDRCRTVLSSVSIARFGNRF